MTRRPATVALVTLCALLCAAAAPPSAPATASGAPGDGRSGQEGRDAPSTRVLPLDSVTDGSVSFANGETLAYTATAGMLAVGATDAQDAMLAFDGSTLPGSATDRPANPDEQPATARMFYTAYFAKGAKVQARPVMFIYDGGPGTSTRNLRIAGFGPMHVVIPDLQHPIGGPYRIESNPDTLLDAADLVFIDAPGTGYSSVQGRDAAKAFYGIDQDAAAFDRFIRRFLSKYDRWNSPKYLFGESYGTTRNAALGWQLLQDGVDLNGIISLSAFMNLDDFLDVADANPGIDNPYFLALPSYAAIAWFHNKVPGQPAQLEPWIHEVERYALGEYASALLAGADLPPERRQAVAAKLESYTGIPAATWVRADLRITGNQFKKLLQEDAGLTTGREDARYDGWAMNPLASEAEYDPYGNAIRSSITAAMNSYAHDTLRFGTQMTYQAYADVPGLRWDSFHVTTGKNWLGLWNVLPDLANVLKRNPKMHVLVMGGYFDLATTYLSAIYEIKHLPIPQPLQGNIEHQFFPGGHEAYVNPDIRRAMHDRVVQFIQASQDKQ